MGQRGIEPGTPIGDPRSAALLLAPDFVGLAHEELHVVHLDGALRLLGRTVTPGGDAGSVDVPLRAILHDALAFEARALILAHNHPGGDATPSRADKAVTRRLADLTRPLDIRLLDHLIFAGESWTSFRALGLL